jgi:hypothetical protein
MMAGISIENSASARGARCRTSLAPFRCPAVATREGCDPDLSAHGSCAGAVRVGLGCSIEIPSEAAFEATSASTATISAHFAYLNAICRWSVAHGVSEHSRETSGRRTALLGLAPLLTAQGTGLQRARARSRHARRDNEQFLGVLEQARVFDAVDSGLNQVLVATNALAEVGLTRFGYAGCFRLRRRLLLQRPASRARALAPVAGRGLRSSDCGVSSTSTSGGTPSFSTIQPSSGDQPPMFGARDRAPSISV